MSSNKKKHTIESENMQDSDEDFSGDEDSNEDEQVSAGNEEIQVEFEGRNPIDSDSDGIKLLLRQLFLKAHINLTDFTNIIISQNYIGSVIKQSWDEEMDDDDDDDNDDDSNVVFGVTTVLNMSSRKDSESIQQLKSLILERAEKYSTDATLKLLRDILTNDAQEELFVQESLASFEYSVQSEADTGLSGKWREDDEELTPFRKVIVIDGQKLPSIVESINGFIHGS
ncbi:CLUMA_CG019139, isoform A [Clunio marinus]|uniref:CLUMA_CG019139, isoform A n=1 Tax=Clunio marinus TaxID=568069 RepID=A0A1J1J0L0_9DIPT|nr:CLUMA_CG019139, isoform A [Clunio marinus]